MMPRMLLLLRLLPPVTRTASMGSYVQLAQSLPHYKPNIIRHNENHVQLLRLLTL